MLAATHVVPPAALLVAAALLLRFGWVAVRRRRSDAWGRRVSDGPVVLGSLLLVGGALCAAAGFGAVLGIVSVP